MRKFKPYNNLNQKNNITKGKWWNIEKKNELETDIFIYEEIDDYWGYGPSRFVKDFSAIDTDNINIHINSPGGYVTDGITIYNIIKRSSKKITVFIDGLAASIASVIAMAGDTIIMPENSLMMIHEVRGSIFGGSADDMQKEADLIEKMNGQIVNVYAERTGKDTADIEKMMSEETWFTGSEAVEAGFADEISDPLQQVAIHDLKKYNFKNVVNYEEIKKLKNKDKAKIITEKESLSMNEDELKAKHPELYNSIREEAKNDGKKEGITEGAQNESNRIKAIGELRNSVNSAEIDAAILDPKATAASVAIDLVKKTNVNQANAQKNLADDGKDVADASDDIDSSAPDGGGNDEGEGAGDADSLSSAEEESAKKAAEKINQRSKNRR